MALMGFLIFHILGYPADIGRHLCILATDGVWFCSLDLILKERLTRVMLKTTVMEVGA